MSGPTGLSKENRVDQLQQVDRGVFYYGDELFHYRIIRKREFKDRKITIKVHSDQRIIVTAPGDATETAIHDAVLKRARWIWKNSKDFSQQKDYVLPKRYISGETQFYLGKRYMLKVMIDKDKMPCVKLSRGRLHVILQQDLDRIENVKPLVNTWYQLKAKLVFAERLSKVLPKAIWVKGIPSFRLLSMQKQWGSCSVKGQLLLNPHLIKAPKECIDYVLLHELCHIVEHNHSEKFWRLLTQVMPDWRDVKAKLDNMAEHYLNE